VRGHSRHLPSIRSRRGQVSAHDDKVVARDKEKREGDTTKKKKKKEEVVAAPRAYQLLIVSASPFTSSLGRDPTAPSMGKRGGGSDKGGRSEIDFLYIPPLWWRRRSGRRIVAEEEGKGSRRERRERKKVMTSSRAPPHFSPVPAGNHSGPSVLPLQGGKKKKKIFREGRGKGGGERTKGEIALHDRVRASARKLVPPLKRDGSYRGEGGEKKKRKGGTEKG